MFFLHMVAIFFEKFRTKRSAFKFFEEEKTYFVRTETKNGVNERVCVFSRSDKELSKTRYSLFAALLFCVNDEWASA